VIGLDYVKGVQSTLHRFDGVKCTAPPGLCLFLSKKGGGRRLCRSNADVFYRRADVKKRRRTTSWQRALIRLDILYFQKVNNFGINLDKLLAGQRIKESFFEFYCIFYFSALQEKKAE
jgi:hypothetical protein